MANPSRSIVINNTDSRITYEPANAWTDIPSTEPAFQIGSLGSPFSTSLKTTFHDGNFTFGFNGSSIQVYGSVDVTNGPQPTLRCTIDGEVITIATSKFPQNNWNMCNSGNLDTGQHVLVCSVQSHGPLFFFDYITFLPSTDDQLDNGLILIDASDLSINYSGNWTSEEPNFSQLTNDNSSFVKMSFTGQQLTWYGIFSTSYPFASALAEFSVDGGSSTQFVLNGLVNSGPFTATLENQLLFQTGELSQGPHEVIVTYLGNEQQTDLSLSYAIIRNSSTLNDTSTVSSQSVNSITHAFTRSAISTQAVTINSTLSPSSLASQPTSPAPTLSHTFISSKATTVVVSTPSSTPISATSNNSHFPLTSLLTIIVGIVLLLLIAITLAVIFITKRRNRRHTAKSEPATKRTTSENLTRTLPLALASSNGDDESTILCRGRTIRTATSDSLDGYVTPPPVDINSPFSETSSFDSMANLFTMPRTRLASHVPTLPTLLDPFVFGEDSSSTRTSDIFSFASTANTSHIRILRPLSTFRPDGNFNPRVDDATASTSEMGSMNVNVSTGQHEDSGIRLGKQVALQYEESSSSKGSPPIYTRI